MNLEVTFRRSLDINVIPFQHANQIQFCIGQEEPSMFALGVSDHVMIAHRIADPVFGLAQRLHGATYVIDLQIRTPALGQHNVVMDIGLLRSALRAVLDEFDYSYLDEHPDFLNVVSTTERVAEHVANRVVGRIGLLALNDRPLPGSTVQVTVRESPVAYAAYERKL